MDEEYTGDLWPVYVGLPGTYLRIPKSADSPGAIQRHLPPTEMYQKINRLRYTDRRMRVVQFFLRAMCKMLLVPLTPHP